MIPTLKSKYADFFKGLGLVLLVCVFAYSSIQVFKKSTDKKVEELNQKAQERQEKIQFKLDSIAIANEGTKAQLNSLKGEIKLHDQNLNEFRNDSEQNLNDLIKIRNNEKSYINPNVTTNEQLEYLKRAKYEPFNLTD